MKKMLAALLAAVLLLGACALAEADYSALSDAELHAMIDGARNELAKRELVAEDKAVILEQDGVTVYLTGDIVFEYNFLKIGVVVVNDSDKTITLLLDEASVNGWTLNAVGVSETPSGKKQKGTLQFLVSDGEIESAEEVEDIEAVFKLWDANEYETVFESDPIAIHF